jgi:hypothetical protein
MNKLQWILPLVPVAVMIAGVPFFSSNGRIWILPELAFWFFIWILLAPVCLFTADRLRARAGASEQENGR